MVAETFSDVFPAQGSTPQSFTHRHLAHQIMRRHRHAFGVGEDAGYDADRQALMRGALQRIMATDGLSRDLSEMAGRMLGA